MSWTKTMMGLLTDFGIEYLPSALFDSFSPAQVRPLLARRVALSAAGPGGDVLEDAA